MTILFLLFQMFTIGLLGVTVFSWWWILVPLVIDAIAFA